MSFERNDTTNVFGDHSAVEVVAPWLAQNLETLEPKRLKKILVAQNEEIIELKLLNFEAQIKINQRDDEIKRLRDLIEKKLACKPNKSF